MLLILSSAFEVMAFDATLSASGSFSTETTEAAYQELDAKVRHNYEGFEFLWDVEATSDGTYGGLFYGTYYGGVSLLINEGGLKWENGYMSLELGKLKMFDAVSSPYSLALSSAGNSAINAFFSYDNNRFFYDDRWIALNFDSTNGYTEGYDGKTSSKFNWPDRSAVIKNYGLEFDHFKIGFQDIAVYTNLNYLLSGGVNERGPLFDAEYFLSPAPSFLIQYAETALYAPWQKTNLDDNSIMGFFGLWWDGPWAIDAQFLVDDINMNRILDPSSYQNPDKFAWTLGVSYETQVGTFRLDHAGALKYMFESSTSTNGNDLYSYTFYPDTEYIRNGSWTAIDPESNMLGYVNGENNIAFMASWANSLGDVRLNCNVEFRVTGTQSPANPWASLTNWTEGGSGDKWLDESTLERRVLLKGRADYGVGKSVSLFSIARIGYVWNQLQLCLVSGETEGSVYNGIPVYSPSSICQPIASITVGLSWNIGY
jgi:hypothetical protein